MMWKEVLLFFVPFLTYFDAFLDLVILPYFHAISIDLYAINCLINFYFV